MLIPEPRNEPFAAPLTAMEISSPISTILAHKPNRDIWVVSPETTVFDAIELMAEKNIGALMVTNGDEIAGIVSERDYTRKVILLGRSSKETTVSEIMISPVQCVGLDTTVDICMQIMTEKRFRHLPVVESGQLVGIVSIGDLVKRIISDQAAMIDQLEKYIIGAYPG